MNPGEGIMSALISLIHFKDFAGLREGTVVAAFLVGSLVRLTYPRWNFLDKCKKIKAHRAKSGFFV